MPNRLACFALCILGVCLAACGDDITNITGTVSAAQFDSDFPSQSDINGLGSDDGFAFTNSFAKVGNGQFNVFWNKANGHAIVLYVDNFSNLWAHYWNGSSFTSPVHLSAPEQDVRLDNDDQGSDDDDIMFVMFRVLFLNSSGRTGDAIITWVAEEGLDGSGSNSSTRNGNDRLFGAYFDMSAVGSAPRYGFGSGTTLSNNDASSDVTNSGFVSDSLCYSHGWFTEYDRTLRTSGSYTDHVVQPEAEVSGQSTSFAFIIWRQEQTSTDNCEQFYYLEFDLNQSGNALPVQVSRGAGLVQAPTGVVITGDTEADFVTHNGYMIWNQSTTTPASTTSNFLTQFAAGGPVDTITLSTGLSIGVVPVARLPAWQDVYGDDHGLDSLYVFFVESDVGVESVMCAKVDRGGVLLDRELADIDAGVADVDDFTILSPSRKSHFGGTRINRTAEWILVVWTQDVNGVADQTHCNVVQTRLAGGGARTLTNSVASAALVPNQDVDANVIPGILSRREPGPRISIQYGLANGGESPRAAIQSNLNRINFAIRLDAIPDQTLIHNGVIASLSALDTTPPTFSFAVTGAAPAGRIDAGFFDELEIVDDLGTTDGAAMVIFQMEDADRAVRLYGFVPGGTGKQLISRPPGGNAASLIGRYADVNRIVTYTTPHWGPASGAHSGDFVHLFYTEPVNAGGEVGFGEEEGLSLKNRYFSKSSFRSANRSTPGDVDNAFRDAFTPPLTSMSRTLDFGRQQDTTQIPSQLPRVDNEEMGPMIRFATSSGNTIGIYWRTRQHEINGGGNLWYQEFTGNSWFADPQAIDNETITVGLWPGNDNGYYLFPRPISLNNGNTLSGALIFYCKPTQGDDNAIGKHRRWFVEVRE